MPEGLEYVFVVQLVFVCVGSMSVPLAITLFYNNKAKHNMHHCKTTWLTIEQCLRKEQDQYHNGKTWEFINLTQVEKMI